MSSAGRAANSNGCVSKPKEHATGLIGFAAQIGRSSLIGSCAMEAAEHREPCESRGSCTDLGAPGGEIPPGDSTNCEDLTASKCFPLFRSRTDIGWRGRHAQAPGCDLGIFLGASRTIVVCAANG